MTVSEKIKKIINFFNFDLDEVAKYLGITTQSLRNKFNRDSFSIRDLIIISRLCNADLNMRFIIHDEIEPVSFGYDMLPKEDIERIDHLYHEKAKHSLSTLSEWLPKLPPEEQEKIVKELQLIQERAAQKKALSDQDTK